MKKTLFLSTIAASLLAVSTASFAQNMVVRSQEEGNAAVELSQPNYAPPVRGFSTGDYGYQGNVAQPRRTTRTVRSRAPLENPTEGQQ